MMNRIQLNIIWPKEGWSELINDERTDDVLKQLDLVYDELRGSPRDSEGGISRTQWETAYENGLMILKALFRKTKSVEDALAMNQRFAERLLLDYSKMTGIPLSKSYEYWALSKKPFDEISQDAFNISKIDIKTTSINDR